MLFVHVFTTGLLFHVVYLQGQDGKPIQGHSHSFGILPGGCTLRELGQQDGVQALVDFFDTVVPQLVQLVNLALAVSDYRVGNVLPPGLIFHMPKLEIVKMFEQNQIAEVLYGMRIRPDRSLRLGIVPERGCGRLPGKTGIQGGF